MISAAKAEIDQAPVGVDDRVGIETQHGAEIERAGKGGRRRCRDRVGAVEILDDLGHHDGEAEGHEDLIGMGALVEVLDQPALHHEADGDHDGDGEQDRQRHRPVDHHIPGRLSEPVIDIGNIDLHGIAEEILARLIDDLVAQGQKLGECDRTERADHEEGAVGEVDHTQRAEDQRQTEGDQRIGRPLVEAVENLKEKCVHGPSHLSQVLNARPVAAGGSAGLRSVECVSDAGRTGLARPARKGALMRPGCRCRASRRRTAGDRGRRSPDPPASLRRFPRGHTRSRALPCRARPQRP